MHGPSFRFRLERLRALRERKEDAAKQALAVALTEHDRYEEELQAAADRVAEAHRAQLAAASGATSVTDLLARQTYIERAERTLTASRHNRDRHALEVERLRAELTEAARDRQTLERLKDHRRADYERELDRREGIALDEIAITNYLRRAA
jgi:flagellar export protein FliJ